MRHQEDFGARVGALESAVLRDVNMTGQVGGVGGGGSILLFCDTCRRDKDT